MPTPEQLKAYAEKLPPIYRDVLTAFSDIVPGRKAGEGIDIDVIAMYLINQQKRYPVEEVEAAIDQLEEAGFVEVIEGQERYSRFAVCPTPTGEGLITAITGKAARTQPLVPELPKPTW